MKENFPLEYLYVDVNGDTYYKRYSEKKEKCNVNPYTLASTPVIFAPHSTVQTIFDASGNELKELGIYTQISNVMSNIISRLELKL